MYDTHAHLNFKAFAQDYHKIITKSLAKGMFLNLVGTEFATSKRAVDIAQEFKHDPIFATVGLHPTHLSVIPAPRPSEALCEGGKAGIYANNNPAHIWDYQKFKELAGDPKVVAIGETGLDYYRFADNHDAQRELFLEHVKLANELNKPLVIHCRPTGDTFDAYDDLLRSLRAEFERRSEAIPKSEIASSFASLIPRNDGIRGVLHCCLADFEHIQKFLDIGFYISVTGVITYKNVNDYLIDAIRQIPLDRLMIETDCPYLSPEPFRGQRNEPLYVEYVAEKIATIKKISVAEVIEMTQKNGEKFFLIKD